MQLLELLETSLPVTVGYQGEFNSACTFYYFSRCADSSAKMRTLVLKSRKCELEISAVRPESRVCCASNSFRSVRAVIWVRGQGLGLGLGLGFGLG